MLISKDALARISADQMTKDLEIVDALGNDGNASMPEDFKRPNPLRKMMMMMMMMMILSYERR